ncbi:hypothetical protein [Plantactinospora sonchi]|uniref:Uncharacterized protein n=1 Tax=Plantactinospora sonchi TaxID=1544735 RepID=A0ABU7RS03_9ACTN
MTRQRYVIHLTVTSRDLDSARLLARTLTRSLHFLPELSPGETTVSEEGDQVAQHRVFCDRLLDGGRRCPLRAGHVGTCFRTSRPGDAGPDDDLPDDSAGDDGT